MAPLKGDSVTLLYREPITEQQQHDKFKLTVFKVVHGFNKMLLSHGASGSCNIDVACREHGDKPQVRSVGMLLTDDHQRYCSGALINNANGDGKQYFLTANHCVFSDVSYFIVGFNYQYEKCYPQGVNKAVKREPIAQLVQGLRLVSQWEKTDYALLEIKEPIPDSYNVYLAGFDLSEQPASDVHAIHHPSGDVKKISTFKGSLHAASWSEGPTMSFHLQVPAWTEGVTERGSSGSPLFTKDGLIIGHLRGGQSSCEYPTGYDLYGGIAYDWSKPERADDRLSKYLNPGGQKHVKRVEGAYLKDLRK